MKEQLQNGLYIIGNGFDIHHKLKTSYANFGEWLETNNSHIYERVRTYLFHEDMELWNQFETQLAGIDADSIIDEASNFLVSYGAEDWSDSYHHDFQFAINEITEDLSDNLKDEFVKWITGINACILSSYDRSRVVDLNKQAHFLSFNYTNTLTDLYGVSNSQIKYIHGSCDDGEIVLGHAYKLRDDEYVSDEDTDPRFSEGLGLIRSYFEETFKSSVEIIEQNEEYFDALCSTSKVFVLGHSIADVDLEYFVRIAEQTKHVPWVVSYYGDEKKIELKQTLNSLGINNFLLQPLDEIFFDV